MAINENTLGQLETSAVYEMANIGLGHATTALAELTGHVFHMTIPNLDAVPVATISEIIGGPEELCMGVYMPFEGDADGHLAFLFPWASAQRLWRLLLREAPASPDDLQEIHASAMLEIGNILNSSFLNAIGDMTNMILHATPPLVSVEMAAAIAETIVAEAEMNEAIALAVETSIFEDEAGGANGTFLCIPSRVGLRRLFAALGIQEAA